MRKLFNKDNNREGEHNDREEIGDRKNGNLARLGNTYPSICL